MESPGILGLGIAALRSVIDLGHLQCEVRLEKAEQVASSARLGEVANARNSTTAVWDLVC